MTAMPSPNLVAIGDNCLDVFLNKDLMTIGGNALNVAVQWRRRGWQARYFGAVGDDAEGDILLDAVATTGLVPEDVERRRGETAVTLLLDEAGDRKFLMESFGVGQNYLPAENLYKAASVADWVHLGTNAGAELLRRLIADRVPFSVDVSTAHLALPLQDIPLLFASGPDAADASIDPIIEAMRQAGAGTIVLTCGSGGAYFDDGSQRLHTRAIPISVLDTCGAGDSFIATFLTAFRFEGLSPEAALAKAAAHASETCTYLGGFRQPIRHIPDWLLEKYAGIVTAAVGD
jgi:fructoselysine 6-kinase